jgi:hypothetical protein
LIRIAVRALAVETHMGATGAEAAGGTSADFAALVRRKVERCGKVVRAMG